MISYKGKNYVCHIDLGMHNLRGKWTSIIICHLSKEPIRYLDLQHKIKGISPKILTEQLKALEEEGIVSKLIYPESPPRVEYSLTQKGQDLFPALEIIGKWAEKYYPDDSNLIA